MNGQKAENQDSYKSLLLLDEIAKGEPLSQRDLSKRLHIALGLVNSYVKNLVSKGYITISTIPAKRYTYYLTPKGFSEKTRLTYQLLQDYTNIYKEARRDFRKLFADLSINGTKKIIFAGADEVAEIAYISLQEFDLELEAVVDDEKAGMPFFKTTIMPLYNLETGDDVRFIVTTIAKKDDMLRRLISHGISPKLISAVL